MGVMSTAPSRRLTEAEYLAIERQAETKSEFYNGEMFAMAGAKRNHNLIVTNLVRELSQKLRRKPCEVYPSDMRLKVGKTGLYTYPDVVVLCGEPRFLDDEVDTLLNPTLLIEVLSESTASYVRGVQVALLPPNDLAPSLCDRRSRTACG
jgi:Uma2 family endonuclease